MVLKSIVKGAPVQGGGAEPTVVTHCLHSNPPHIMFIIFQIII